MDGPLKLFFVVIFGVVVAIGAFLFLQMEYSQARTAEERAFIQTRGRTKVPLEWIGKVGKGI